MQNRDSTTNPIGSQSPVGVGFLEQKVLHLAEKPWVICRLGAPDDSRIIARFVNKQDAEDDLRTITRFVKDGGQYVVAFDVVEVEE